MAKELPVGLIHGLGRGAGAMLVMAGRMELAGLKTFTLDYPSRSASMAESRAMLLEQIAKKAPGGCHLVGHSLGGVLAVQLKSRDTDKKIGRVVQLGSPNLGSPIAEFAQGLPIVGQFMGPNLGRIAVADMGLGEIPTDMAQDLGIIAGDGGWQALTAQWGIDEPSDGKVSVRSALGLPHADAVLLPVTHALLPLSGSAATQAGHFIRTGRFEKDVA